MNKGKAEERAGRAFPSEGREGAWAQGRNSKQLMMLGHEVRNQDRQERVR